MKAFTVHQPYAQLLAIGAKQYETRPMVTKYRGLVAIHAGLSKKAWRVYGSPKTDEEQKRREFILEAIKAGDDFAKNQWRETAFGAIIAYADLVGCYRCEDLAVSERERLFGDWTPGRYAWEIANVRMLHTPIPCKGQLGLWNVKPEMIEGAK